MEIRDRFKQIRLNHNLKQDEFGENIGLNKGSASAIERGIQNITTQTIQMIIDNFGVSPNWLFTGEGSMYQSNEKLDIIKAVSEYIESQDKHLEQVEAECLKIEKLEQENADLHKLVREQGQRLEKLEQENSELKKTFIVAAKEIAAQKQDHDDLSLRTEGLFANLSNYVEGWQYGEPYEPPLMKELREAQARALRKTVENLGTEAEKD